ncbi:MAG: hypothetical protein IPP58_09080 [Holophagaceae bacterium]|uniref:Uncharacterized protein n=1 Tax=Candidatus Geothrix skivensis TaxID=2954439 RepID=A0A9D7XIF4_9BACT|nr:hypothetical protein [Candidatus Geothrix skivensis]
MPIQSPPPPVQIVQALAEMPLLPGSDPMLLGTFQWALAHSPSLREVVRLLPAADRKARYRLVPALDANYGNLRIRATEDLYHIDIGVAVLGWSRCGDALEPWVAIALFLALETARHGKVRETGDPDHLRFARETRAAAFAFQARVRQELALADPVRMKALPDGELLCSHAFRPGVYPPATSKDVPRFSKTPKRRPLPDGVH